jgi:2-keto-4-pentenoate hydratase
MSFNPLSPTDQDRLRQAAELLLGARRTLQSIDNLPEALRPRSDAEAAFLQDVVAAAFGPIGGWKIGGPNPQSLAFGPMPLFAEFARSGATVSGNFRRLRGLEAEIAFMVGTDLPARATAYSREEVIAAIAGCHPAIEMLESAFDDPDTVDPLCVKGDLANHGGFAYGPALPDWQSYDFATEGVEIVVDGVVRASCRGSNPAGPDLVNMIVYLANEGAERTGGLETGQLITTGSWTGKTYASPGSEVVVRFEHLGSVNICFEK